MTDLMDRTDDTPQQRTSRGLQLAAASAVIVALVAGIFVLGRLAPTEIVAMGLTAVWFGVVLAVGALMARRRRQLAVPMGAAFAVTALATGVLLGLPNLLDREVSEQVATVDAAAQQPADAAADEPGTVDDAAEAGADDAAGTDGAASGDGADSATTDDTDGAPSDGENGAPPATNTLVASGTFVPLAHPGKGNAEIIDLADGGRVLTLTNFSTDNGPDLKVYLTTGDPTSGDIGTFVDLGALKGNRGNQQYEVPDDVNVKRYRYAVVWCRAFSVGFTSAELT